MSRVGRRPVDIPEKIQVSYHNRDLDIKGPKGALRFKVPELVELKIENGSLTLQADYENDSTARKLMGTTQAIISNMIIGVTKGFRKQLNLVGVGYRASVSGNKLELNVGYSHSIQYLLPKEISGQVNANTQIILESPDKQLLGQVAANIRSYRPPEPYKGKGILFEGEVIRKKAGKSGKAGKK